MNKSVNKVNLDRTLNFTVSSFAYKDPYQSAAINPLLGLRNRIWTFFAFRNLENEFTDFRRYTLEKQFQEIYSELAASYRRSDKVVLSRSLSESMNLHVGHLLKAQKPCPFLK